MKNSSLQEAQAFLRNAAPHPARVSVVGDLGLDAFVRGNVARISPEAPVPVLLVEQRFEKPGLAANVVANLGLFQKHYGAKIRVMGLVGEDAYAESLWRSLREQGVESENFSVRDGSRPTTLKTRFIAGAHHQLLRVDEESEAPVSEASRRALLESVKKGLEGTDLLVVQDYAKGLFSADFLAELFRSARAKNVRTLVDPHRKTRLDDYKGAWLFKPNLDETEIFLGRSLHKGKNDNEVADAAFELKKKLSLSVCLITRGAHGMTLVDEGDSVTHLPAFAREVFDVTGAGDTVVATLAGAIAAGASLSCACALATAAASVVVGKIGTATASLNEILKELEWRSA